MQTTTPVLLIDNAPDRSITDGPNAQSIRIGPSESHTYWQGSAQSRNPIVPTFQRVVNEFTAHETSPAYSAYLDLAAARNGAARLKWADTGAILGGEGAGFSRGAINKLGPKACCR